MYTILGKLIDKKDLVGYRLKDMNTGSLTDFSIRDVKLLTTTGKVFGVSLDKEGNLKGSDKVDLRKLKHINVFNNKLSTFDTGKSLKNRCEFVSKYKERFVFNKLMGYLSKDSSKVCIVYGLRRTGKTVMLLQAINKLDIESCAYISLNKEDKSVSLLKALDSCKNHGIKYVFIDEITVLDNLLYFIPTLSDNYASNGMHIVISGTDSFMLNVAEKNELYDRCELVRTTYVSFKEYCHLFGRTKVSDYLHYGGVLNRDVFYDESSTHKYIDTAISENIQHSIEICGRARFGKLYDLVSSGTLKKCIEQSIQISNGVLTSKVLSDAFKSRDLGSMLDLAKKESGKDYLLDKFSLSEEIRYNLRVVDDANIDFSEYYNTMLGLFELLDLVVYSKHYREERVEDEVIFTLPGLRFNQVKEVVNSLLKDKSFNSLSKKDRELLLSKLTTGLYGDLLEETVMLQMIKCYGKDKAYKFNSNSSEEIDCVVETDKGLVLIEVKWSDKVVESSQCRYLANEGFMKIIDRVLGYPVYKRVVLYRGKDCNVTVNDFNIEYVNVSSFLLNHKKYID